MSQAGQSFTELAVNSAGGWSPWYPGNGLAESCLDDVVRPFENYMKALHTLFPSLVAEYALLFELRFDLLEFRARIAWVCDSLRSVRFPSGLQDGSNEVHRLAQVLHGNAVAECVRYITYCEQRLPRPDSPCMEVEIRLAQIVFKYLLESALTGEEPAVDVEAIYMAGDRLAIPPTDSSRLGASGVDFTIARQYASESLEATPHVPIQWHF